MLFKAQSQPKEFEKAIADFVKEWFGYEYTVISGSNFALKTDCEPGTTPAVEIALGISGNFSPTKPKGRKAKKIRRWGFAF